MADKIFYDVQARNQGVKILTFSFKPADTSAPTGLAGRGVASVVRDDAGDFTVTLEDAYPALLSGHLTLGLNADTDLVASFGAIDVVTAKTVKIRLLTDATPTDLAANANNIVFVTLFLRNTSVT